MKSALFTLIFWAAAGAVIGYAYGSGLMGLFKTHHPRDRLLWKPLTREEYVYQRKQFPIYGAEVGAGIGVLFILRGLMRSGKSERDSEDRAAK